MQSLSHEGRGDTFLLLCAAWQGPRILTILRYSWYALRVLGDDFNQNITMNIMGLLLALLPGPWYVTMDSTGITTTFMTYSFYFLKLKLVNKQLMPGLEIS